MTRLRVLHCPHGIAGNPQQIARAERDLGLDSRSIMFTAHAFGYPADETLMQPGQSKFALERHRWRLLWRAIRDFDVIHFNFGTTIMPTPNDHIPPGYPAPIRAVYNGYARLLHLRDLPLLKRLGKGIAITYQGDDARQGDYCLSHFEITYAPEVEEGYYSPASDAQKRRDIAYVAQYADRIYALNPDLLHMLTPNAEFLPYASVDPREWQPIETTKRADQPLTVLHAPSHRGVKGTAYILAAVERLQAEGIPVELLLIENMQHAEARKAYERADVLIDQLLGGWYGGLAVELMALAKPVICYLREGDLGFLPADMRADLPIINATPNTIYEVLKLWVTTRRGELPELGHKSRAYVERWHDPLKIAARLKVDYEMCLRTSHKTR